MLSSLFDEYSLNARVRPALLVLLPLIVAAYLTFPQLYTLGAALVGLVSICGFITALAHFTRHRGRLVESALYKSWGGKITTKLLRHRDSTLDRVTKLRYHDFLSRNIPGWELQTPDDEAKDPSRADSFYESATKWLLEKTRDTSKYNLLFKENIGYGFRRNCYGVKAYGIAISVCSLALAAWSFCSRIGESAAGAMYIYASAAFSVLLLCWWTFVVRSSWVEDAARSYSIRLLASCDSI